MLRHRIRFIVLLLALSIPTVVVFAAESVILGNFQIDLVSQVDNGNDTHTFTYAVTAVGPTQALSHWTLGIDTCVNHLISPLAGSYTTITNIAECGDGTYASCEASNYTVVTGSDPTLGINGIKFEDGSLQLTEGNTHVFQITVSDLAYVDLLDVGTKAGGAEPTGEIDGPVCGTGTAVSLASSNVSYTPISTLLPLVVATMLALTAATLLAWRRQAVAVGANS